MVQVQQICAIIEGDTINVCSNQVQGSKRKDHFYLNIASSRVFGYKTRIGCAAQITCAFILPTKRNITKLFLNVFKWN